MNPPRNKKEARERMINVLNDLEKAEQELARGIIRATEQLALIRSEKVYFSNLIRAEGKYHD